MELRRNNRAANPIIRTVILPGAIRRQLTLPTPEPIPPEPDEGNLDAARWLLEEKLNESPYSELQIPESDIYQLAREASLSPLPVGVKSVKVIAGRIDKLLAVYRHQRKRAKQFPRASPKRHRMRPSLHYDHKKPLAPSKSIENAISLEDSQLDGVQLELEHKIGSESQEAHEEQREERLLYLQRFVAGWLPLQGVLSKARKCGNCGKQIPDDESRSVILRVDMPALGKVSSIEHEAVHCQQCRSTTSRSTEDESWTAALTEAELHAYRLDKQGLTQEEIGQGMTPVRSQGQISRILKKVESKRTAALAGKYRKTGGA